MYSFHFSTRPQNCKVRLLRSNLPDGTAGRAAALPSSLRRRPQKWGVRSTSSRRGGEYSSSPLFQFWDCNVSLQVIQDSKLISLFCRNPNLPAGTAPRHGPPNPHYVAPAMHQPAGQGYYLHGGGRWQHPGAGGGCNKELRFRRQVVLLK